jgi:hypothetical protein
VNVWQPSFKSCMRIRYSLIRPRISPATSERRARMILRGRNVDHAKRTLAKRAEHSVPHAS